MVARAARPFGLLANAALALVVTLVVAALIEAASRLLESRRPKRPAVAEYLWDWETRWDGEFYTVDTGALGWPPTEWFNVDGVRDRTHTEEKPPRTYRLVFLGDSVTLGAGILPQRAYPQVLQRRLEDAGRRIEVFNVGLWGWSTRQERLAYERLVRRYRPDRVVLAICLNDIPELQNNLTRPAAWLQRLHERSALVRLIVNAQGREIGRVEELFTAAEAPAVQAGFAHFEAELRALRAVVQKDGASLAVLVFPFRFQVEPGAPPPSVQARLRELCRREGLPFLDLLPVLAPLGPAAFVDYDHLSPAGARSTAAALLTSELLPAGYSYARDLGPARAGARAAERLPALLEEADASLREAAVWALGEHLDDAGAQAALVDRLQHDPDVGVRSAVAEALGREPGAAQAASAALFAALDDPSQCVRWAAARALASRAVPQASQVEQELGRLTRCLRHDDRYVRAYAAWALGRLGPSASAAAPQLVEALQREGHSSGVAAHALAQLGPGALAQVPALLAALDSPEAERRWNAALALGHLGAPARDALPRLTALLVDREPRVRAKAALAVGLIGGADAQAQRALSVALGQDPSPDVRAMSARSLGRLRPATSETRKALGTAKDDDVRRVRLEAEQALEALDGAPGEAGPTEPSGQ